MSWKITLADVKVSDAQMAAAHDVLASGWLSMGPRTKAFEAAFAAALDGGDRTTTDDGPTRPPSSTVAVSSATAGLLLALQALGVGPGDDVVVPSFTFVADANVVRALGARPVFADIEAVERPLVGAATVDAAITEQTKAAIVVHYGGYACDAGMIDGLRRRGIAVVEDAAHAVGPIAPDGRWLTPHGDVSVYSFFANKNLPIGEGGMVATADPDLADRIRLLRSHGMTSGTWDRHTGHASDYDVVAAGWNFRPPEINAALGEAGLPDLPAHNERRRQLLDRYREVLQPAGVTLIGGADEPSTGHICVALLPAGRRPAVRATLEAAGIQSSFHYPPIHRFTEYRATGAVLPVTDAAAERLVTLPLHPLLDADDVDVVADAVRAALG